MRLKIPMMLTLFAGLTLLASPSASARSRRSGGQKAWLGTALVKLTRVDRRQKGVPRYGGVLIQRVIKDSPAARTGFRPGDVIMRLGNKYVYKPDDVIRRVASKKVGSRLKIDIIRNGRWLTARVRLTPRPHRIPGHPPAARTAPAPRPAPRHHGNLHGHRPPAGPAAATDQAEVIKRLRQLEREVRLLRKVILEMKRRCRR